MAQAREKAVPKSTAIVLQEYFTPGEKATIEKLNQAIDELKGYFVERDEVIDIMVVARLCKQHVCEIGPPGIAKSYLIECFMQYFVNCTIFSWQLQKFTTPEEIFGPYSLHALEQDKYIRNTEGKLPRCIIAYLDELFEANTSIRNAMNSAMNERVFEGQPIPLENVYAATNYIADEKSNTAFFDRFLFRLVIEDIQEDDDFVQMLLLDPFASKAWGTITQQEMTTLRGKIAGVNVKAIIPILSKIRQLLLVQHIAPSSRRFKWSLRALQARAVLSGRDHCTQEDTWILQHVLWTDPKEIPIVNQVIMKAIDPDMARITEYHAQAQDVAKQLAPLDPKDANTMAQCAEGTQKLKAIADSIAEIREKAVMVPKVRAIAEKLEKAVREKQKEILKTKMGVAF